MKILYFNHYAGSMKHGMEYRPAYLASEWTKQGHDVTIVAATYSHVRTLNVEQSKLIEDEVVDGIKYTWLKTPSYATNGVKRVINIFCFVGLCFLFLFRWVKLKPDVVIASSTYPLDIFPCYVVSKLTKAKLIFEVHDLWPLSPMELGGMSKYHPFIFIMQIAENFAYKKADKVASMLPCAADHMMAHGMKIEKFQYIPNGIREEDWKKADVSPNELSQNTYQAIKKIKDEGHFIVGYTGTLGIANAMHVFIETALSFKNDNDIVFIIVGNGILQDDLKKLSETNPKIKFYNSVPKSFVPKILELFDVAYIGANKNPLYRFGISPNKLFDYMCAAKPIISSIEAGNDPVGDAGCGLSVPAENPESLRDAILSLKENKNLFLMGNKGKEYVLKHHMYEKLAEDFLNLKNF